MSMKGFMAVAAMMLPLMGCNSNGREIDLVARDMAFYLQGNDDANPVIEVKAGERLRIILRNEERGMLHDFAVPSANAATRLLRWNEEGDTTFTAPDTPGTYDYVCRPHLLMMKGTLRVVS